MKTKKVGYLQCQQCGKIYPSKRGLDIEEFYVRDQECPCCGKKHSINVGENKDLDLYTYINPNCDRRY